MENPEIREEFYVVEWSYTDVTDWATYTTDHDSLKSARNNIPTRFPQFKYRIVKRQIIDTFVEEVG
jgi:hypothetical protein